MFLLWIDYKSKGDSGRQYKYIEKFLEERICHVKFFFDREEIRLKFKDHMLNKIEYYIELGYDEEEY